MRETKFKEIVQNQLLLHGFNVDFEVFQVSDKGIKFVTKQFQTQPIIFKSIVMNSEPSSYTEDGVKYYYNVVKIHHKNFSGGCNGFELFTIVISEANNRISFEKCF